MYLYPHLYTDLQIVSFNLAGKAPLLVIDQPITYRINLDLSSTISDEFELEYSIRLFFRAANDESYNEQLLSRPSLIFTQPSTGGPRVLPDHGEPVVLTLPSPANVCAEIDQYCVQVLPVNADTPMPISCISLNEMNRKCDRPRLGKLNT